MKAVFPKLLVCIFLFLNASPLTNSLKKDIIYEGNQIKKPGSYFIFAPSGLNLRAASVPSSKRLLTIPYGAKVELTESAENREMKVDQFSGGMAKVKYGDQVGYLFDGYISRFPAPKTKQTVEKYVEDIREARHGVLYEKCTRDWSGLYQEEEAISLNIDDWEEAFLVARQLYQMPPKILFPKPSKKESETINNPDKEEFVWEDAMVVKRNAQGEIISMNYYYRLEGGGRAVTIEKGDNQEMLRLSLTLLAD